MARGKTQRKRKERKSRRVIRKTRGHRGGMYSENERNAAEGLLAFSRGFYERKPSTIHTGTKLEYLREHEKGLGILLEPYTIQAKEAGKPRDVMIEEYKALREITKQEFLRDLRISKVSKLEDIYPAIEKVYPQVFNILNNKNPKELVKGFNPTTLAKIVIYAQEIITYSEKFV
jgi:hypothetical protein